MKKILIVGGAVLAAVGIAWAWHERAAVERDLNAVARRVHDGLTPEVNAARRLIESGEGRLKWLETQASEVATRLVDSEKAQAIEKGAHAEATRAHARINDIEKRLNAFAARLRGRGEGASEG